MKHSEVELQKIANELRMDVLEMGPRSGNPIHVGPSYSCADILTVLYYEFMRVDPKNPKWEDRDRFIISKGHATPVLYALLAKLGFVDREELWSIKNVGCRLQGHPSVNTTPGIDMTAGSLGNGLSIGLGMALGLRQQKKKSNVYVLLGDGECQEGLVMEAMMAAPVKGADNLVAIVDYNHHQSSGSVEKIMPLHPFAEKWKSFGWRVFEIDGHNIPEIYSKLSMAANYEGRPTCIIAHTVKGKGIDFMEHNNAWHTKLASPEEYEEGMRQLKAIDEMLSSKM